jgi:hypothetical protein
VYTHSSTTESPTATPNDYKFRNPKIAASRRRILDKRRQSQTHKKRRPRLKKTDWMASLRFDELSWIRRYWYKGIFPNTKNGLRLLRVTLNYMKIVCPHLIHELIRNRVLSENWNTAKQFIAEPIFKWGADTLGRYIGLENIDREELLIHTIGAIDAPKAVRVENRKAKDREYQANRRLANGATPRSQSITQLRLWEKVGMGRSAWYAAGKPSQAPVIRKTDSFVGSVKGRKKEGRCKGTADESVHANPRSVPMEGKEGPSKGVLSESEGLEIAVTPDLPSDVPRREKSEVGLQGLACPLLES